MFNVGDYVRVKRDLEVRRYNGLSFINDMLPYRGRVFKIASINDNGNYRLENVVEWYWNDEMLESISEEEYNMEQERNIVTCSDCGREIEENESYDINGEYVVCEDCYNHYYTCECCRDEIYEDDICCVGRYEDTYVCESCRDEYYSWCPDCERYYRTDDMYYDEDEDCYYCSECWDNRDRSFISGYHNYHRDFELLCGKDEEVDKSTRYLGTESEMENEEINKECVNFLKDKFDAILSHDGSLNTYGAMEWVDDARTMQNHYEVYEDKKEAFEKAIKGGYRSHDTSTCGLHIHASRPYQVEIDSLNWDDKKRQELLEKQNQVIDRIILVMEVFKDELMRFSRRKSFNWCKWLSDVEYDCNGKITSIDYIKKHKGNCMGHQRALNLENHSTIEFRIFKGTLNVDTYYACLELVDNIMKLCGDLSLPLEKITWAKLTSGKFVRPYVEEKHIWTTKKVVDTSEIDKIWINIKNRKKRKIARRIFVELKKWYKDFKGRYDKIKNSRKWDDIRNSASRLMVYESGVKSLKEYQDEGDYASFKNKLNDMIFFDLCCDNDNLRQVKNNLKDLYNVLCNMN